MTTSMVSSTSTYCSTSDTSANTTMMVMTSSNGSSSDTTTANTMIVMTYPAADSNVSIHVYIDVAININIYMANMTSVVVGTTIVVKRSGDTCTN